jgi:hypothetical protein
MVSPLVRGPSGYRRSSIFRPATTASSVSVPFTVPPLASVLTEVARRIGHSLMRSLVLKLSCIGLVMSAGLGYEAVPPLPRG